MTKTPYRTLYTRRGSDGPIKNIKKTWLRQTVWLLILAGGIMMNTFVLWQIMFWLQQHS